MALFDFLKRKKESEKASAARQAVKKPEKKSEPVKVAKETKTEPKPEKKPEQKRKSGFSYDFVKEPHISEKASYLAEKVNQYIFKVPQKSGKSEIKKTIEGVYGVDVLSVNIIKIPQKKRRLGRTEGFKKGYVKAVVKVKEGQKIEIL